MRRALRLLLLLLVVLAVWLALGRPLSGNAFVLPLGACDLTVYHDTQIAAVACSGRDLMRIWPLSMEQPRWEDGEDEVFGSVITKIERPDAFEAS